MWLNTSQISVQAIDAYRTSASNSCPNHVVLDGLFDSSKLDRVLHELRKDEGWKRQRHTYSALYVDDVEWSNTSQTDQFVQRDIWQRSANSQSIAEHFLRYLRSPEFMALLSNIFAVRLTDENVASSELNSNFFRLGREDFIRQHADDSPGRELCLLLYLNKHWQAELGGELTFQGSDRKSPVQIEPIYNRCIVFDPSSKGSEHWVQAMAGEATVQYRYNVTSWYWSI